MSDNPKRSSSPRFRREGATPHIEPTTDDELILRQVHRHRFLRADDVYRLFPNRSADRLSRRLMLLFRAGYLDRPKAQIDRYNEGGSQSMVYGLGNAGARHLKHSLGVALSARDWSQHNRYYTRENLDHTLAIARYLIDLERYCATVEYLEYLSFERILERAPAKTQAPAFPKRWSVAIPHRGANESLNIIPDAIFGVRRLNQAKPVTAYVFLEMDRGSMTIAPSRKAQDDSAFLHRATILRKFIAYGESWRQHRHEDVFGIGAPRILFLTTSEMRARSMREASALFVKNNALPPAMFLFGVIEAQNSGMYEYLDASGVRVSIIARGIVDSASPSSAS